MCVCAWGGGSPPTPSSNNRPREGPIVHKKLLARTSSTIEGHGFNHTLLFACVRRARRVMELCIADGKRRRLLVEAEP
jgi:hypothetical protein